MYHLALRPDCQEKLQVEIDEAMKQPGGLTYDRIMNETEYLSMVMNGDKNSIF